MRPTFVFVLTAMSLLYLSGCHEQEIGAPDAKAPIRHFQGGAKASDLDLGRIRFGKEGKMERLVFDSFKHTLSSGIKAKQSGSYRITHAPSTHRLVGKLSGYRAFSALASKRSLSFKNSRFIKKITLLAHPDPESYTFEILFRQAVSVNVFSLQNPARIVIDIKEAPKTPAKEAATAAASEKPDAPESKPQEKIQESNEAILRLIQQVRAMQKQNDKNKDPFDYSQYFTGGVSYGRTTTLQKVALRQTPDKHTLIKLFSSRITPYTIHYDDEQKRIVVILDGCGTSPQNIKISLLKGGIVKQSKVVETKEGVALIFWLKQDARINVLELHKPTNITIDIAPMYRLYIGT